MRNHFGTQALAAALLLAQATLSMAQEKPAGGPSEGIKVHGHWTIEIRNPDGSQASRHEFENSLSGGGPQLLSEILGRVTPALPWRISVPSLLCKDSFGVAEWCNVVEPHISYPISPEYFHNLTLTVDSWSGTLELRGNFIAEFGGAINRVSTMMQGTIFSVKALSAPVPVSAGQIVQLKVVFSFS